MNTAAQKFQGRPLRQFGLTLLELAVSLGIISTLGGFLVTSSYVTLRTNTVSGGKVDLSTEITRSTRWLVRDIHQALTSDLADGGPAAGVGSFTWNVGGAPHTCVYDIASGTSNLRRVCPGTSAVVADGISALQFSRTGELITITYTVTSTVNPALSEDIEMNVLLGSG